MTAGVLVLNADFSPLAVVDMTRAVSLLVSVTTSVTCPKCHVKPSAPCIDLITRRPLIVVHDERKLPQAVMFESDPTRMVRSPSMAVEWPLIIALTRYVYLPYAVRMTDDAAGFATRRDILERDRYQCCYCAVRGADTIDHVFPRSRGGADSWENLVASCKKCNNRKGNRTPEEWGHPLLWRPHRPDKTGYLQRKIWAAQEAAAV